MNVLIYGATGGIGQAVCQALIKRHANLFVLGRSSAKLKSLQERLNLKKEQVFQVGPLCDPTQFKKVQNWIKSQSTPFQTGIHMAGMPLFKKLANVSLEEWNQVMDINLTSAFCFYRLFHLARDQKGYELVFLSSASTSQTWMKNGLYGASKAGLDYFAKTLQTEVKHENGRVWLYKPGSVNTDFFKQTKSHLPPNKMIDPEELAEIIAQNLLIPKINYFPEIVIRSD